MRDRHAQGLAMLAPLCRQDVGREGLVTGGKHRFALDSTIITEKGPLCCLKDPLPLPFLPPLLPSRPFPRHIQPSCRFAASLRAFTGLRPDRSPYFYGPCWTMLVVGASRTRGNNSDDGFERQARRGVPAGLCRHEHPKWGSAPGSAST